MLWAARLKAACGGVEGEVKVTRRLALVLIGSAFCITGEVKMH